MQLIIPTELHIYLLRKLESENDKDLLKLILLAEIHLKLCTEIGTKLIHYFVRLGTEIIIHKPSD